jgi:hypothetical protein
MSDPPNPPVVTDIRDPPTLFTRARTTSVELARLILTLATATIGAISLEALHGQGLKALTCSGRILIRIALVSLVLTIASALGGIAADAASDASRGWAIVNNETKKTDPFHIRCAHLFRIRKCLFISATVGFTTGIACAGILILSLIP